MAKARALKVWGLTLFGTHRHIIATSTKAEAARLLQTSLNHFNQYAARTGNDVEVPLALSKPRTPFHRRCNDWDGPYKEGLYDPSKK